MPRDRMLRHTVQAFGVLYFCVLGVLLLGTGVFALLMGRTLLFGGPTIGEVVRFFLLVPLVITVLASPLCLLYGAIATKDEARRHPRTDDGHCFRCGYDLTGLAPDAVCPECGGRGEA